MKTWINQGLADLLRGWLHDHRNKPQVCCEGSGREAAPLVESVLHVIRNWDRRLLLCFLFRDGKWRGFIFTLPELKSVFVDALISEEVISIVDLETPGGCSVDFSPDGSDTFDMLYTAWGGRESSAVELAKRLKVETFIGN